MQSFYCGKGTDLNSYSDEVYGAREAKNGNWGWQIVLKHGGIFKCGGILINNQWV